jgi:hypothetical protein
VRQQIMRLTLIALVALLATGCAAVGSPASPSYPDPQESAVMRGNISEIVPAEGDGPSLGSIRVEGEKIEDNPFPVAIVYVNDGTRIVRDEDGEQVEVPFADLAFGQTVSVTFSGPVRESYPVQIDADEIVILADHPGN